jgi:hypothetical protein
MSYTVEQINHIIYNNRSYEGLVKNFMPKIEFNELQLLLEIGKQLKFVNKIVNKNSSILIDKEKLDLDVSDIEMFPDQLENIKISSRNFNEIELTLLKKKGIPNHIIEQYDISPLSQFKDLEILKIIGVTSHPMLERLVGDGISDGLIIPLYNDGKLINTVFRKTNELTKLKYGISVPSLDFWGDEILESDEIWLCEGLFDMMALREQGKKCISASSCALNDFQYFKIISKRPKLVNIFTDNDVSGYRSSMKSQKIFGLNGIPSAVFSSTKAKDAGEHFFELGLDWSSVNEINITSKMINRDDNIIIDFLKYLEQRKF